MRALRVPATRKVETVVLRAVQEVHWTIHRAFCEYQRICEDRRHLAAEIGELIAGCVDGLVAAGWSEHEARNTNVAQLVDGTPLGEARGVTAPIIGSR